MAEIFMPFAKKHRSSMNQPAQLRRQARVLKILHVASLITCVILSRDQITKGLIRVRVCTGLSALSLYHATNS